MVKNEFEEFLERAEQGLEEISTVLTEFKKCVAENNKLRKEIGIKPTSYIEMSDVDSCSYKCYYCALCDSRISERDRFLPNVWKKIEW